MKTEFPRTQWRLLRHAPDQGARNMAIDEAMLEVARRGNAMSTLRLYDWQPACLSLGLAQPIEDVDLDRLAAHGWELVRRPTGGRAILHTDELTYSVIEPSDEPRLAGGVLESYKRLSGALLNSLKILGMPVQYQMSPSLNGGSDNPVCFEVPSDYEITLGGKKLIGSAQARRKGGVLQHGSLPLFGDIARITQALRYPSESERESAAERVRSRAATVEEGLGRVVSWQEAAEAFVRGFAEELNIEFIDGDLSDEEKAAADRWETERYAHETWTERV